MTHDELLAKINKDIEDDEWYDKTAVYNFAQYAKTLRAVVIETDRPPISDDWRWADGWKCAMLTILTAIEKELR